MHILTGSAYPKTPHANTVQLSVASSGVGTALAILSFATPAAL